MEARHRFFFDLFHISITFNFQLFFPDCAILNQEIVLHNIALTKVDAILDKIDHIGTDLAPPDVKMFLSNTRVRFSVIRWSFFWKDYQNLDWCLFFFLSKSRFKTGDYFLLIITTDFSGSFINWFLRWFARRRPIKNKSENPHCFALKWISSGKFWVKYTYKYDMPLRPPIWGCCSRARYEIEKGLRAV